jgi:uncharacterized membrane protein YdbT with pleckstrin-like domain
MVPEGSAARSGSPGYGDSANNEPNNEHSEELSVLELHPHWKTLLRPLAIAVVLIAAALVIEAVIPSGKAAAAERLVVAAIAILALLIWLMVPVLRWRLTTYELTTRRLRVREGILSRRGRDIPLARVNDVSFDRGLTDRIFGSGRLVVESAGEHGQIVLNDIPNVENVQSTLFKLVEDEQQRLGGEQRYGQP